MMTRRVDGLMRLRLLGPVDVVGANGARSLGGARPTRILLALVLADQHRATLDELAERCFGDDERPDDPVPALRTAMRRLRRGLGDEVIETRQGAYELNVECFDVDVDEFERCIARGRESRDPVAAVTEFRKALALWRGRPFGEFGDLEWIEAERVRLGELHLSALEGWHDAHLRNGTATEIIPSLQAAVVEHPMRERLHRQLMEALFRADRQADALAAFQHHREVLAQAGLVPNDDTIELERRIAVDDPTLRSTTEGRPLRDYRIVERLGEGAFSIVYRGVQPSVDRDVAIKQIRAEFANRPEFIRRFESEAHMVARLEHPYIVPLYDYWREPGSAYLVMRYLPAGNLETSLLDGPWALERVTAMVEQVGSALAAAHRAGIVHRDVKPANILLDDIGNTFLADFGIALGATDAHDPQSALSAGSPAYASPEQLRHEQVGPSADVHGLAIAVYETLTGRLPFPDEPNQTALLQRQLTDPVPLVRNARPELPAEVDDVLQRATAKDPSRRFASIEAFVDAFVSATATTDAPRMPLGTTTLVGSIDRNPYKGLRPFDESDGADFVGRDRLIDQLLQTLADHRLVAVIGPSGSGKSSVVRAGLLPAIRTGALIGSSDWFVATMLPGSRPFEDLEAALISVAADQPANLLEVLRDGERGVARALRRVLPASRRLLLVIDQFEELFTLCDDEVERRRFLDGLASAIGDERSPIHVVLTLRADFYDRPLRYELFGRLVRDATVAVLPLAADELEQAIVIPAASVGCEFEPGLVSEIVASVADQPGALPLMQFALTELFDRRVSNMLTREAYHEIGGVAGALALAAEDRFAASSADDRAHVRRLFGQLVTLGEGTADTRRRVLRHELAGSVPEAVIDHWGAGQLLTFDRDPSTRAPTVEIAHEALITQWPRLADWLVDDRDDLQVHRALRDAAVAWRMSDHDPGDLYRGGRLDSAEAWVVDHRADMNELETEFFETSRAAHAADVEARAEQLRRERRSNRRLRTLLTVAAVVAGLAVVAGIVALQQRQSAQGNAAAAERLAAEAETNEARAEAAAERASSARATAEQLADDAEIRRIISDSARLGDADPVRSILLALTAQALAPSPETSVALHRSLARTDGWLGAMGTDLQWAFEEQEDTYRELQFVDETTLVARSINRLDTWDLETRQLVSSNLEPGGDSFLTGTVDEFGGELLFVATSAARTSADPDFPSPIGLLDRSGRLTEVAEVGPGIVRFATTNDGSGVSLVSALDDVIRLDGRFTEQWRRSLTERVGAVATASEQTYVGQGQRLRAFGSDGSDVWQAELTTPPIDPDRDGAQLAIQQIGVGPADDVVYAGVLGIGIWSFDARTGAPFGFWPADWAPETSVAGRTELVAFSGELDVSDDHVVFGLDVFDRTSGAVVRQLPRLDNRAPVTALSPSGRTVAIEGPDGIELWSLDGSQLLASAAPTGPVAAASADASGELVAWRNGGQGGTWDLAVGVPELDGVAGDAALTWAADGSLVEWEPGLLTVRSPASSPDRAVRTVATGFVRAPHVSVSVDSQFVAVAGDFIDGAAGEIVVDELVDGEYRVAATLNDLVGSGIATADQVRQLVFSPDGTTLAAATVGGALRMYSTSTWAIDPTPQWPELEPAAAVAFSGDGERLAVHRADGELQVIDIASGRTHSSANVGVPAPEPAAPTSMVRLAFGPEDETVMVGTADGGTMWSTDTLEPVSSPMPNTDLPFTSASHDGRFAVSGLDSDLLVWNLDAAGWPAVACRAAGRDITEAEWDEFAPTGEPFMSVCQAPAPASG